MGDRFARRLSYALQKRNLSQTDVADTLKINKGALSSYLSGRYEPRSNTIVRLADYLQVSPAWLAGFDVDMNEHVPSYDSNKGILTIPFINQRLSAGTGENFLSSEDITVRKIDILESMAKGVDKSTLMAAEVVGDSMVDLHLYSGDIAIIARGLLRGEGIYAINYAGDVLIKTLSFDSLTSKITIISANKNYPPRTVDADSITVIGKVLGWIHKEMI